MKNRLLKALSKTQTAKKKRQLVKAVNKVRRKYGKKGK
jgi:hypothetical protein